MTTRSEPRNRIGLERRCQILAEYGKWTALSAVRSKCPIKATEPVYRLLNRVAFDEVLDRDRGAISAQKFDAWHKRECVDLCDRANVLKPEVTPFPVGWSAKLINVFLKTTAYVGDLGRAGLRAALHPPLDNRLRDHLVKCFRECPEIRDAVDFHSITGIVTYEQYERIIDGCRAAAEELAKRGGTCSLFEVEQLWSTGAPPGPCRCS